jgi:3-deoxy-manno-octulosonate cytidylyltransferase (CMP-KDO synthetase)
MIVHVWRRGIEADIGPVLVAAGDDEIAQVIRGVGGHVMLTNPQLRSGSERVHAALEQYDPKEDFDVVVNLQGDLPTIDPMIIQKLLIPLQDENVDITTAATVIRDSAELQSSNVVKVVLGQQKRGSTGRALYFSRACVPFGPGPHYHHIGVYAFQRRSLNNYIALGQSKLEERERLEQLRAIEAGMWVEAVIVDTEPLGVDTAADLERARQIL